jgi:hypothetical protein
MQRCPPAKRNNHTCGLWYHCHHYSLDSPDRLRRWDPAHLGAIRPSKVDKCVPDGDIICLFSDFNITRSKFDGSFWAIWTHRRRKNWYWGWYSSRSARYRSSRILLPSATASQTENESHSASRSICRAVRTGGAFLKTSALGTCVFNDG